MNEISAIDPRQTGIKLEPTGKIEFKNIIFKYPTRRKSILRNLNLVIEPNQSVAIVGHSGTGKSTLASLLLRFYDSQKGQVLLDGIDIRDLDLRNLRS